MAAASSNADESDPKWKKQQDGLCAQYRRKIVLKKVDVKEQQMTEAVRITVAGLEKEDKEAEIAKSIKDHFDAQYGPRVWHVCVGRKYGSHVTHEQGGFLYFNISRMAVLIFVARAK